MLQGSTDQTVKKALDVLETGGVIAYPTETYYGLGADPFNETAVKRLYALKKREREKPILLLIPDLSALDELVRDIPFLYRPLMDTYWPGPLTLLFPASERLSPVLTGNTGCIGIRLSSNSFASHLLGQWGRALTATSANISGERPAASAKEARDIFGSSLGCILDGGPSPGRKCSTLLGIKEGRLHVVRQGELDLPNLS
ncbi:unnamed protein product [Cyprideis torosa]|uniref:Threonylcarbamoyl-AMP synthase n=1 Tax=Cyprideis torosa TaxID=163714 RepID=A0A7R8ZQQ4_9CRUS|nr:unnamed protein product [Cyprideis torosa]CAG0903509.1 unnamed protein product [Cyprideis torosa]